MRNLRLQLLIRLDKLVGFVCHSWYPSAILRFLLCVSPYFVDLMALSAKSITGTCREASREARTA